MNDPRIEIANKYADDANTLITKAKGTLGNVNELTDTANGTFNNINELFKGQIKNVKDTAIETINSGKEVANELKNATIGSNIPTPEPAKNGGKKSLKRKTSKKIKKRKTSKRIKKRK